MNQQYIDALLDNGRQLALLVNECHIISKRLGRIAGQTTNYTLQQAFDLAESFYPEVLYYARFAEGYAEGADS